MTAKTLVPAALVAAGAVVGLHAALNTPARSAWLPDPKYTTGAFDARITEDVLRSPGFTTRKYRAIGEAEKAQVAGWYGLPRDKWNTVEFDHYLSIEVGGSEDPCNLWPELLHCDDGQGHDVGAKTKDRLEDYLGAAVKAGRMSLKDAQGYLVSVGPDGKLTPVDWPVSYIKLIGPLPPFKP